MRWIVQMAATSIAKNPLPALPPRSAVCKTRGAAVHAVPKLYFQAMGVNHHAIAGRAAIAGSACYMIKT